MTTIALEYIKIINPFNLKTSINTCNQHKQDTFDPFNHSMCHCASKFDIEIIVFKDAP